MQHLYTTPTERPARRWVGRLLGLCALALGLQLPAQAQSLNYNVFYSETVAGTYTDLGNTGTVISTANTDNANSSAQSIGFTFTYSGQSFTQFILNTNGYLKLGSTAPSTTAFYSDATNGVGGPLDSNNSADVNLLLPFNTDLEAGSSPAEYRVATTGTAPNRVCTIQWKNVSDKLNGSFTKQYRNFSFQVKLYETSNNVEFVYGAATASTGTAIEYKTAAVGIKGASAAENQIVALYKEGDDAWAQAQFVAGNDYFDFLSSTLPDAGRTYRFLPAPARDAAPFTIYTLGKVAAEATPHRVRALVVNTGLTTLASVPVTLTVSGATSFTNTQTVTNLAPGEGDYVTFDGYAPTATGANTIAVAVGADDQNGNNQQTTSQQVTQKDLSYIDSSLPFDISLSIGGAGSKLATKYSINQATVISALTATFGNGGAAPYRLQIYNALGANGSPGDVLYTSAVQTRPATAGPVTLAVPNIVVDRDFYVVITEESDNAGVGIAGQYEFPLRPNNFYVLFSNIQGAPVGWVPTEALDFNFRLALDVTFGATPTCAPPTSVAFAAITPTSANVTFTASPGAGLYVAEYGPAGFTPGSGTTITSPTSPITLTGLSPLTTYDVYVSKSCGTSARYGPLKLTTLCQPAAVTFPYTQNFDAATTLPCGYTILDANNDGNTWEILSGIPTLTRSRPNALICYPGNNASDDWVFTQALPLPANQRYTASFYYYLANTQSNNQPGPYTQPANVEVFIGTSPTPAAMTTNLYRNTSLPVVATAYTQIQGAAFTPPSAGSYYIGIHNKNSSTSGILIIDDLSVTTTALPVNQALSRAIEAYPNPTTGMVRLNLSATNARQRRATVFNTLGQAVLTRPLTAAAEQQLDLSTLSSGLYTVQLQLDNDVVVKRVSLQK
ncbi:T9SS type A sorting domain-containing protein [Hymenobacter sp. BT507]|uniref:T9SS type A sorting domain-containing protein n=1 Tax=Hymenobacter citatus TaxID=2763506 RepID=A0ABR7MND2_9BACT|nr:T9SS type A sorting domain-containing protein [Hymenobacter citatus]MBC6612586.1 T9SS type A sorting domain-containing protein [Hymenobacter citatus]